METNEEQWTEESHHEWLWGFGIGAVFMFLLIFNLYTFTVKAPNNNERDAGVKVCRALDSQYWEGYCVKDSVLIYEVK